MNIISVHNLAKSYKGHEVLKDVSFEVQKGTVYALLGSNGAGKTTIINILSTLLATDKGNVTIAGLDVRKEAKEVRGHISLTGQYAAIDDLLTGRENMHMMGNLNRVPVRTVKARTSELLRQFDLEEAANKRTSTYSGGMKRKLDLAISLLVSPSIIFLDEPTTGLDPRSRQELWHVIRELAHNGTTILLTTQYLDEADNLADKIGVLNAGKIVAEGTARELKHRIGGEYIELTFQNADDCIKAQKLILDALPAEEDPTSLTAPLTHRLSDVRNILDLLTKASLEPLTLNIRQPTLDDVFMKLTETAKMQGDK